MSAMSFGEQWSEKRNDREAEYRDDPSRPPSTVALRVVPLIYTVFFFIEPIARHRAGYWLSFTLVYAVFLALYMGIPYARGRVQTALFVGLFALGFAYVPFNPFACGLFVYPMALLPFVLPSTRQVVTILAIQLAAIVGEGLILRLTPWSFLLGGFLSAVTTILNLGFALRAETAEKLEQAHGEIARLAKTAERERIARDLHDVLGHTLTLMVLKAQVAERLIPTNPGKAATEVAEIEATARKALGEVREAVLGFRSQGLTAEIERAQDTLTTAGIAFDSTVDSETLPTLLTREQEMALTLTVREAVTNVVRHSGAKRCTLNLSADAEKVRLTIFDDGTGVNSRRNGEGFGLKGMRERLESLGGSLTVTEDNTSGGTRLVAELPRRLEEAR